MRSVGRLDALIKALGYEGRPTFFDARSTEEEFNNNFILRQAIRSIGVDGVFCLRDDFSCSRLKPIVYLAKASGMDEVKSIWRKVWSQGAVPFLLVLCDDVVYICNAFQQPDDKYKKESFFPDQDGLAIAIASFSAQRIASSVTWKDFDLSNSRSIDYTLVSAIEELNKKSVKIFPRLATKKTIVNALIGKLLYIYVLLDRDILSGEWLLERLSGGGSGVPDLVGQLAHGVGWNCQELNWSAKDLFAVFATVDDAVNGSVFQINEDDQSLVPDELCHLVHRVMRCGEVLVENEAQLSFFNVSFPNLRTETISAIYERFVAIEDGERKKDDGVFYTPPHLADHVLDRVEELKPINENSRVIDASAGSGIFLVGAYRRLLERCTPQGGWSIHHARLARRLLRECVFGIEKHVQAASVCRFSLYLTMLDYVGHGSIDELVAATGTDKFFPDLSQNILPKNAFSNCFGDKKFTHVVGNPPWSATSGQKDRYNKSGSRQFIDNETLQFSAGLSAKEYPVAHNRLSDLFVWLAKTVLADNDAIIALILPTRSLVGRQSGRFAHSVARHITINWISNFSHLRRKLFSGAEAPACLVIGTNRRPSSTDRTRVYRPLISSLPGGKKNDIWSLMVSEADIDLLRAADFQTGDNGWFRQCMLSSLDRRLSDSLKIWSSSNRLTFGDFLTRSGLVLSRGGSPAETGVERPDAVSISPLTQNALKSVAPSFRGKFAGNMVLIPRSMTGAFYQKKPMSYSSSFNAIIPENQISDFEKHADATVKFSDPVGINALLAYLNSNVLKYFASLFGATYLMDRTRFEKNDFISLPCPYKDIASESFRSLGKASDIDEAILAELNAGEDFREAFYEFVEFKHGYANSQVPGSAMELPASNDVSQYTERLQAELSTAFSADRKIRVVLNAPVGSRSDVIVSFSEDNSYPLPSDSLSPDLTDRFLGTSIVIVNRDHGVAFVVKPKAKFAWTLDQAVSDAMAVRREIKRTT